MLDPPLPPVEAGVVEHFLAAVLGDVDPEVAAAAVVAAPAGQDGVVEDIEDVPSDSA